MEANEQPSKNVKSIIRLVILVLGLIVLILISFFMTGTIFPSDNQQANIFQSGLLMVILGSLFLEDKFTRPIDAVVNGLTGGISLITVFNQSNGLGWIIVFIYCFSVFIASIACIAIGRPNEVAAWRKTFSTSLYKFSTTLGSSRILFSVVFLFSVFSFYGLQSVQSGILVLFWGVYIAIWPLKIPNLIQSIFEKASSFPTRVGTIIRMEDPDLVVAEINTGIKWTSNTLYLACTGENEPKLILPLFSQVQNNRLVGTGLCIGKPDQTVKNLSCSGIYEADSRNEDGLEAVRRFYNLKSKAVPVGLVTEGSTIGMLKFETWPSANLTEGQLVFCINGGKHLYYQIVEGTTRKEELTNNQHGFVVVEAIQLGTLDSVAGFQKYSWLPTYNTAMFSVDEEITPETPSLMPGDFILGYIPSTKIPVVANINDLRSHHLALFGTTGRGKTELAFDLIRIALENDTRVFCVDLTLQYGQRLKDLNPEELSLPEDVNRELGTYIFNAETGDYGGGKEKRALDGYILGLKGQIDQTIEAFLADDNAKLGLFNIPAITNTRSTIQITELYLSAIFNYAKNHIGCKPIWLVLEEAHTIVPEVKTMGVNDYHSQAVLAKISQIALQGRKYNVGLFVIAQRTATVSKTVLTQCNSIISFSLFDQTGLEFLSNYFGKNYVSLLPNLQFLQAVVYGNGIKSMKPIIIEIPKKDVSNVSTVENATNGNKQLTAMVEVTSAEPTNN